MDPSSALGRVVVLKNIVAKPELNSRYANVEEYNYERKRYLVRLIDHTSRAPPVSAWVTADKFTSVHPRRFPDHADLRELNDDEDKLLARYHTEQGSLDHPIHTSILRDIDGKIGAHIITEKGGLVLGASGGGTDENGLHLPRTRIEAMVIIKLSSDADILEIEDVFFYLTEGAGQGMCVRVVSGNVIFRRCRFEGGKWGVHVEGTDESSLPHGVFENCVFKAGYCCFQGPASFLNCCFRDTPTASISIFNQASVIVEHCDIRGGQGGIQLAGKQCEVSHSIIRDVQIGVMSSKGNCSLNDCLISNVVLSGAQFCNSTVHMTRCRVEQCRSGVIIGTTGSVSLVDSIIVNCNRGVSVGFDCVGTVAVNGCTFSGNVMNIDHIGQSKCVVSVDGKIFEKNGVARKSDYYGDLSGYIASMPENEHLIRRSLKNMGKSEFSPLCGHCGSQEPVDAKYKKCSRCNKIAYCSPECQKAAWKTHKTTCVDASLIA